MTFYGFAFALIFLVLSNLMTIVARRIKLQFALTMFFLALMLIFIGTMIYTNDGFTVFKLFSVNPFSLYFSFVLTMGVILVNVLGYSKDIHFSNFSLLSSFALVGMYFITFATSLITIFIGLELVALPTIFTILLSKKIAIESAVKLFILSSVAVALFAFGMVLVFGATGSAAITESATVSTLMVMALALFIAALSFEAALFPFNLWVPDVYQGATTYVTALLGGVNKKVGFVALLEILFIVFFAYKAYFVPVIYALCVLSMFYGNFAALAQKNVKRMLAYSSISQAGYIAIGLAVATQYSLQAAAFQIFAHMLAFVGAMAVVIFMESRNRHEIGDYLGLHKESSIAAFCMTIFLLSLIGTPLTMGFIGKFMLFSSAINAGMILLALFGIFNSIISVYYYLKVVSAMYADKVGTQKVKIKRNVLAVMVFCMLLVIAIGVYPNFLINLASTTGAYLLQ